MTTPAYIVGAGVTVTIGTGDTTIGLTAEAHNLVDGPTPLVKRPLGSQRAQVVPGQGAGTFSANGGCTDDNEPTLAALRTLASQASGVDVEVTYPSGAKDAFKFVGTIAHQSAGEGFLDWTIDGQISGDVTNTPAGP